MKEDGDIKRTVSYDTDNAPCVAVAKAAGRFSFNTKPEEGFEAALKGAQEHVRRAVADAVADADLADDHYIFTLSMTENGIKAGNWYNFKYKLLVRPFSPYCGIDDFRTEAEGVCTRAEEAIRRAFRDRDARISQ